MGYSPEERARRAEQCRRQWQTGNLRPAHQRKAVQRAAEVKRERSSQVAQDILAAHRDRVEAAIASGLKSTNANTRLKAAELALKLAMSGERQQATVQHHQAEQQLTREQMIATLAAKLTAGPTSSLLRRQIEGAEVVDAEVISGD